MGELKKLTLGIEEEYQIIDPKTRELTSFISEFLEKGANAFAERTKLCCQLHSITATLSGCLP